jgi:hypothetical protein
MGAQADARPHFVDLSARGFNRKYDPNRPMFAVNHDESIRNVIPLRTDNLEADGAAFSCALDWLMTCAGYSEAPRSFVRAVIGAIRRDEDGRGARMAITDERLAELMNCSTKTVQRQRKLYLEQERGSDKVKGTNFSILAVIEGEFDHNTQKHAPTIYEFLIGRQVSQTVERARTSPEWKRDQLKAMHEAALEVFDDIDEAPPAQTTRPKRILSAEAEAQKIRKTMVALARRLGEQTRKIKDAGSVAKLRLDELHGDIDEAMLSGDLRQVFVNKDFDPPTGQNVHQPPPPEPVHIPEERMWTAPHHETPTQNDIGEQSIPVDEPEYFADAPPIVKEWCESPEMEKSTKVAFSEESFTPPAELTIELDPVELAERAAIQAEALGIEFDDEGEITFVSPGVPDDVYEAVWQMRPVKKEVEMNE